MPEIYELAFRTNPVAMMLTRRATAVIVDVNDAGCRLLGRTRESLVGNRSVDIGAWASEAERDAMVARLALEGQVLGHETLIANDRQVRLSLAPLAGEGDACVLITLEDITDARRAEAERLDHERRFRAIFNSTFQFIGLLTPDGVLLEANQAALDFAGLRAEDVVGRPFWDAHWWQVDEATPERLRAAIAEAAAGQFVRYEAVVCGRGMQRTPIDFSLKPITDERGRVVLLVPEGRDIGEMKAARAALRESEERFRSAFEAAAIGMAIVSPEGRFEKVNTALCDIVGYPREQLMQLTFQEITHPDDLEADLDQARRLAAGEIRDYQMTKRYIHRAGHVVWIRLAGSVVRDEHGGVLHFVAQVEDVTAARENQQSLERMLEEKDVLLREVHHRVKSNLQVVSSLLSLQKRTVTDPATRSALDDSRRRVQTMSLVHERLYKDHGVGAVDMRRFLTDLAGQVCRSFMQTTRVRCYVTSASLVFTPDVAVPCGLVVNELVSNAVRYAFVGREEGTVRVTLERESATIILRVDDDGVGMPEVPRAGSLGMHLVQALARQLEGTFVVESEAGVHATLTFPAERLEGAA